MILSLQMAFLRFFLSRTGFFFIGALFVLGIGITLATWAPSPKYSLDPLYATDWNTVAHNASGWERSGDIFTQGDDVFFNAAGGVGIGNATISAGLSLDVEGNVGAMEFCDNEGLNCISTQDVIEGELAGLRGVILDGGLHVMSNNVGIITDGCLDGYVMEYESGVWNCVDSSTIGGGVGSFPCSNGEILKYLSGSWQCAEDGLGSSASLACAAGEIPKSNGTDWECGADATSPPGGGDLSSIICTEGQVVKYISGAWQCADDGGGSGSGGKFVDGTDPNDAVYTTGDVGVGTANPSTRFEVQGGPIKATDGLIIEVRTSDPSSAGLVDGRMWLRSDI